VGDRLEVGIVEAGGRHLAGQGHADGVRDPLAERSGRRLDAHRVSELGMPRGLAPPLAERLKLGHR
jgi:hypothetical protein